MKIKPKHITRQIGAKASGLYLLQEAGFRVPSFVVIPFSILTALSEDPTLCKQEIDDYLASLELKGNLFAVRSSSAIEDGIKQSFAGQFQTILNVQKKLLCEAIREVLNHFRTVNHEAYSNQKNHSFGIIIQEMIESDFAGVGFSVHPTDGDDERVHLSIVPGCGEALVSGRLESFLVVQNNSKAEFDDLTKMYYGEEISTKQINKTLTGQEIATAINPLFQDLFRGVKKLERLKKVPVDVEFAIFLNKIYWLQVRPITTIQEKTIRIWDNTASESNYSGLTLPLTQSFVRRSFEKSYRGLANRLGIKIDDKLAKKLNRMSDSYKGVLYYNVTAWQQLIVQLPFGIQASHQLTRLWGMEPAILRPEQSTTLLQRIGIVFRLLGLLFKTKHLKKKYHQALNRILNKKNDPTEGLEFLKKKYLKSEETLSNNWIAPSVNGLFALIFLSLLKRSVRKSKIIHQHPNFTNDILQQQTEVITVKMVRDFQNIIRSIQENDSLIVLFNTDKKGAIWNELKLNHSKIHQDIINYITDFGVKAEDAELKLETITFATNPDRFIEYLSKNLHTIQPRVTTKLDYQSIISQNYGFFHPKRYWILLLVKQSIARVSNRENYRFDRTRVFAYFRSLIQNIEKQLINMNALEQKGDIFYLEIEEILTGKTEEFIQLVAQRKTDYSEYAQLPIFTRYKETATQFIAVEESKTNGNLKGIGCCSGIVQGTVLVFESSINTTQDFTDKIVIAPYFEPGNIGLFSQATGLISARGNLLSHTAILCREMGVPSIVGVKGLLTQLKTGDRIEMNGATGTINHIGNEAI